MNRSGKICLANPHDAPNHSPASPPLVLALRDRPRVAAAKGMRGWWGKARARAAVTRTVAPTSRAPMPIQRTRAQARSSAEAAVSFHFAA
jgi:hypothetical protein